MSATFRRPSLSVVVCVLAVSLGANRLIGAEDQFATAEGRALRDALVREAEQPGKPEWKAMLLYLADLHGRSIQPRRAHFPFPYQSIGPGYQGGDAFGHIDLTHERLDTAKALPQHVRDQIQNELAGQQEDGLVPGAIYFDGAGKISWKLFKGFPPIWPVSAEAYIDSTGDDAFLGECLDALIRQIGWFENKRRVPEGGFYYLDVVDQRNWESGMDEGVRYDDAPRKPAASVDACSHMYLVYDHATRWSRRLGRPHAEWQKTAESLRQFIQAELWDTQSGFFYDHWSVRNPEKQHKAFEGMWPVVVGAATPEQATRVIDEHLLNPAAFYTPHPIATVAPNDPKFQLRMWRGPAWNCMTYWAARGCLRYGRRDAARRLLETALDATAVQFRRTGTVWEFYHPQLGDQAELRRKNHGRPTACRDYIGHNPLFAMVNLWQTCGESSP